MKLEFFNDSKVIIVGAKPTNRSGIRKMLTEIGGNSRNIETSVNITEALSALSAKRYNTLIFDDDCQDQALFPQLTQAFSDRLKDAKNSLVIILGSNKEFEEIIEKLSISSIVISKPYTIGSFNDALKKIFEDKNKKEKKDKKLTLKAQKTYQKFCIYIKDVKDIEEDFLLECQKFMNSLNNVIDLEAMVNVLSLGINYKRYKELELFVEAWINTLPVKDDYIPDISRVLIYNYKFEFINKLKAKDEYSCLAIGVGLIIAASVLIKNKKEEVALQYIEKGVKLAAYKPIVMEKALSMLLNISDKSKVDDLLTAIHNKE